MIEDDFPSLQASVGTSVIARAGTWLWVATSRAAADATVTRLLAWLLKGDADGIGTVRSIAIAISVAALSAWGLSTKVPLYVATAIPGVAFALVAALAGLVALRPAGFARQWQASSLRRLISTPDA